MKSASTCAVAVFALLGVAIAQQASAQTPSTSSDPAVAAPDRPNTSNTNTSGSGTATSGGKDDNGDRGRDAMADPNRPKATNDKSTDPQHNEPAKSLNK
jgi:hypothetical protein